MKRAFSKYSSIDKELSPVINTFRGLSSIVVLVAHGVQIFLAQSYPKVFPIFGLLAQSAVMVFFVMSGFLITKSLTRNASQDKGFNVSTYMKDRFDRIYPPLLFSLALVIVLLLIAPAVFPSGSNEFQFAGDFISRDGFEASLISIFGSIVFLNGFFVDNISANGPLWSLSFEVWYYVIAGFIVWRPVAGSIIGTSLLLFLGSINLAFLIYCAVWFAGALVSIMHNHRISLDLAAKILSVFLFSAAVIFGLSYFGTFLGFEVLNLKSTELIVLYNAAFGLGVASCFHMLITGTIRLKSILPRTADFSYTLYVIHFPIMLFIYGAIESKLENSIASMLFFTLVSISGPLLIAWKFAPIVENMKPSHFFAKRSVPASRGIDS